MSRDIFALRDAARRAGLANRVVAPGAPSPLRPAGNRCACGNLLTISDPGSRCRQCVLEGRNSPSLRVGRSL